VQTNSIIDLTVSVPLIRCQFEIMCTQSRINSNSSAIP
jgi:hypothetical protein